MANSYSLMDRYGKYTVQKSTPDSVRKWYIRSIYRGEITWTSDSTYSKSWNMETAMRYLRNLRAEDPNCEEDR